LLLLFARQAKGNRKLVIRRCYNNHPLSLLQSNFVNSDAET
jgi:hypothetical protein